MKHISLIIYVMLFLDINICLSQGGMTKTTTILESDLKIEATENITWWMRWERGNNADRGWTILQNTGTKGESGEVKFEYTCSCGKSSFGEPTPFEQKFTRSFRFGVQAGQIILKGDWGQKDIECNTHAFSDCHFKEAKIVSINFN